MKGKGKKYKCIYGLNPMEIASSIDKIKAEQAAKKQSNFDPSNLFQIGAQALGVVGNIANTTANVASSAIDGANAIFGAIDTAKLKRKEQQQIAEALQKRPYESQGAINNLPIYTKNGGITHGRSIEAEDGEIMEMVDGSLLTVDGKRHEQGGEDFNGVYRVLENTATKRKDPLSKALVVDKDTASAFIGKKVKKSMSHSDVYEKATERLEDKQKKYIKNIDSVEQEKTPDPFAISSAKMNTVFGQQLPTHQDVFDSLFQHQEIIKAGFAVEEDNKAAYGLGPIKPYTKGKQKTPTGKNSNFVAPPTFDDYYNSWESIVGLNRDMDSTQMQGLIYDNLLQTPEGKKQIRDMWKTYGNTRSGRGNAKFNKFNFNNLTDDQLAQAKEAYTDGLLGARTLNAKPVAAPVSTDRIELPGLKEIDPRVIPNKALEPKDLSSKVVPYELSEEEVDTPNVVQNKPSEFSNPLNWYDIASPVAGLVESFKRDPELYNPVKVSTVNLQEQDPRGALNRSQADFNAMVSGLGNSSVDMARKAQLFTNKLRADSEVISNTENANTQIRNQEELYNTQARDKQEFADQQSRQSYYDRVLQARENQSQARASALGNLTDRLAQRNSFNKNAELLMKLAPAFNQKGEHNGYQVPLSNNSGNVPTSGGTAANGMIKTRVTARDGKESITYMTPEEYRLRIKDPSYRVQIIRDRKR